MFSLKEEIPRSTDLVIVGGGLVGSAVAFFVAHKQTNREREIMVIERDPMVKSGHIQLFRILFNH